MTEPFPYPAPSNRAARDGWTIDPKYLELVQKYANELWNGRPDLEIVESVLLAALKVNASIEAQEKDKPKEQGEIWR